MQERRAFLSLCTPTDQSIDYKHISFRRTSTAVAVAQPFLFSLHRLSQACGSLFCLLGKYVINAERARFRLAQADLMDFSSRPGGRCPTVIIAIFGLLLFFTEGEVQELVEIKYELVKSMQTTFMLNFAYSLVWFSLCFTSAPLKNKFTHQRYRSTLEPMLFLLPLIPSEYH